jgi:hypothetical protein
MNYAVEMGSGAMHTKFHNDWFSHSKFDWGGGEYTDNKKHRDRISILSFFFFIIRKVV